MSYAYAKHTFEDWQPKTGVDLGGNEMSAAPRDVANLRFKYSPEFLQRSHLELHWQHLGKYWMDDENTHAYSGHELLNLRAQYQLQPKLSIFGHINNLADKRYATAAAYSQFSGEEFAPGTPRSVLIGVTYITR